VSELSANGVLEDTLLVVTADHGEELLDHGLVGHGQSLYDELLRVPLLVRPGANVINARPAPAVTDELASHVDLTPTLLAAASLAPGDVRGRDLLTAPAPDRVFAEVKHKRRYLQCVVNGDHKLIRETKFERAPDHASGQGDYNNLQDLFASRPHRTKTRLFDLAHDPGETRDLSHREKDRAEELGGMLDAWWQGLERRGSDTRAIEEDMIRRLESLGYL
ncbi:MAG: sulfatase-like hydrolase/transferase, partial [Gemmatimonadetes bacterium]|nr:sulfatase-like hydrolase/transferase [Gemmatimonadota bacterium]